MIKISIFSTRCVCGFITRISLLITLTLDEKSRISLFLILQFYSDICQQTRFLTKMRIKLHLCDDD